MTAFAPLIGFFGKLPVYPDFVRQNAGGPLARAMDTWIHEGIAQMNVQGGDNWKAKFDVAAPKNFLYHTDDPSKFMVGVLTPGRDLSGRRYPFSLFANVSPGKNGQHLHLVAEAYAVFLQAAGRLVGDLNGVAQELRSGKLSGLATSLPQNLYEFDRRFKRFLELKKMTDFWAETIGEGAAEIKYLLMRNLLSALSPLRGKDLRKFELCLALPLSGVATAQGFQVAVWLAICREILKHPVNSVVAFWDAHPDATAARLYLFFRPPGPKYLAALSDPTAAGDAIWDLATLGLDKLAQAKEKLAPELVALMDNADLSAEGFITALAG